MIIRYANIQRILKIIVLTLLFFFLSGISEYRAQRYGPELVTKKRSDFSIKRVFKKNPAKKEKRKEEKKIKKADKYEAKARKKYWKRLNKEDELKTNRAVYKRMKQNLKRAERQNKGKHPDSKLKRYFQKNQKTKRLKE